MEITQETSNNINILSLNGRLDASTSIKLEEALQPFNTVEHVKVLVDCKNLEYISSAGLRVLLATAKEFKKQHGKISLSSLNPNVKQVFEISGFTSIFPIFETSEEALADLSA